jgi:hypothetical protein
MHVVIHRNFLFLILSSALAGSLSTLLIFWVRPRQPPQIESCCQPYCVLRILPLLSFLSSSSSNNEYLPMKISSPITMAYPGPPRRAAGLARYLFLAVGIITIVFFLRNRPLSNSLHIPLDIPDDSDRPNPESSSPSEGRPTSEQETTGQQPEQPITKPNLPPHPIDTLIEAAETTFSDLLKKESHDINTAAAEYRKRRGRHPPPGFDVWFKFAQENNAVMVEDFFDQIYHDLGPFWGLKPSTMRKEAWDYEMTINVRNQNASTTSDWFWTLIWLDLTQTIEHMLPDMDIPLNAMDEPRIVLPWEDVNKYMEKERAARSMPPAKEVVSDFQTLSDKPDPEVKVRAKNWIDTRKFSRFRYQNLLTYPRTILEDRLERMPS